MVVNDNAGILDTCVAPTVIASRLAPTGKIKIIHGHLGQLWKTNSKSLESAT